MSVLDVKLILRWRMLSLIKDLKYLQMVCAFLSRYNPIVWILIYTINLLFRYYRRAYYQNFDFCHCLKLTWWWTVLYVCVGYMTIPSYPSYNFQATTHLLGAVFLYITYAIIKLICFLRIRIGFFFQILVFFFFYLCMEGTWFV